MIDGGAGPALPGQRSPASAHPQLTGSRMVFTMRFSGGKSGRNGLEAELRRQKSLWLA